jgi:hypothetical protein
VSRTWEPSSGDTLEGAWRKTCGEPLALGGSQPCIETDSGEMVEIPREPNLAEMLEGLDPSDGDRVRIDYTERRPGRGAFQAIMPVG